MNFLRRMAVRKGTLQQSACVCRQPENLSIMVYSLQYRPFCASAPIGFLLLLFMATGCSVPYSKPDGSSPSSAPRLIGTTWRAVEILDRKASFFPGQKIDAHLILHSGGRVGGSTGCNNINGVYSHKAARLSFVSLGSTRMACSPKIMDQERRFLGAMRSTAAYEISGRRLILLDRGGRAVMELIPVR